MDPSYGDSCRQPGFYGSAGTDSGQDHTQDARHHMPVPLHPQQQQQQQQQQQHLLSQYPHHLLFNAPHPSAASGSLERFSIEHAEAAAQDGRPRDYMSPHPNLTLLRPSPADSRTFVTSAEVHPSTNPVVPSFLPREPQLETLQRANFTPPRTSSVGHLNTTSQTQVTSHVESVSNEPRNQQATPTTTPTTTPSTSTPPAKPSRPASQSGASAKTKQTSTPRPVLTERQHLLSALNLQKSKNASVNASNSIFDLPDYLRYRTTPGRKENVEGVMGVMAREEVEKGAEFGPYSGTLMNEELGATKETTWELCLTGKVFFYIDGQKKDQLSWLSHIRSARSPEEQNLEAFQYYGEVYFRTTKVIEPGSELRVAYSGEYAKRVGFVSTLEELEYDEAEKQFRCRMCDHEALSSKLMLRHMKAEHDPSRVNEMLPVVTWKKRTKTRPDTVGTALPEGEDAAETVPEDETEQGSALKVVKRTYPRKVGFMCKTCGKEFKSEGRLQAHAMFHEFSEEHACPICGDRQLNAYTLNKHLAMHGTRPYQCKKCGKSYKSKPNLCRHDRDAHGFPARREYRCRYCNMRFTMKRECVLHERMHGSELTDEEDDEDYDHEACGWMGVGRGRRLRKMQEDDEGDFVWTGTGRGRRKRKDEKDGEEYVWTGVGRGRRRKLKRLVESQKSMEETLKEMQEEGKLLHGNAQQPAAANEPKDMLGKPVDYYQKPRPFKCRYCTKRYFSRRAKTEHEKEVHEKEGCEFPCNLCSRVFVNENRYMDHVRCHEQHRIYRCPECPRTFASQSALNSHSGEHTGLKPFKCELCGKGFRVRKAVYEHKRRMHQKRKLRFFCSFCEKGFPEKGALNKHERRHKGIRPYVCMECGKGFTERCALTAHIQCLHTKEKPFACEICGKTFSLNQNYTYHVFKHKTKGPEAFSNTSSRTEKSQEVDMLQGAE